jgi:hypothetical protein
MTVTTELVRNVWHDKEGVAIQVGPDADGLNLVQVKTYDKKSEEFYGPVRFTMDASIARALGRALINAADDADASQDAAERPF